MIKNIDKIPSTAKHGLVISYFGNSISVESSNGEVFQCHLHRNQETPVVGDHVLWELSVGNTGTILKIEPRHSLLFRGDKRAMKQPIASNIDTIFIVMAPLPIFSEYLIDRYLVAAELVNIPSVIVLNKIDLLDKASLKEAKNSLEPYRKISCPIILSSIYTPDGLSQLAKYLQNKKGVLVGPSGVGKSSIIAALSDEESIRISPVTNKGSGKHTTTATRLYHLRDGGFLIDSPGVREFNLWQVDRKEILRGFKEFQHFVNDCKFRDCQHLAEPDCALKNAVRDGMISAKRYQSYQKLMKNINNS